MLRQLTQSASRNSVQTLPEKFTGSSKLPKPEYVGLDLPHIPEPTRSEMAKELELRLQQLQILLQTFHTE